MIFVMMGVSGCGKSTVGRELAKALGGTFSDADAFHSRANIEKMSRGVPLDDADRAPWLEAMRAAIEEWKTSEQDHVLACSALKEKYRAVLSPDGSDVTFVYLRGSFELLSKRLGDRKGHFFNPKLLASQFEALEEPAGASAIVVDIGLSPREIVDAVLARVKRSTGP